MNCLCKLQIVKQITVQIVDQILEENIPLAFKLGKMLDLMWLNSSRILIQNPVFLNPDIENAHIRRTLHMNRTSPKTGRIVSYPRSRSRKKGGLKDNLIPEKNDSDSKECSNQEYEIMKVRGDM